ncbi:MAG: RHS repeat-associated core domain-containing protein [Chlorobia bacterium]|nr:RHS repeat-associated core domain-containing protein [Fimbriimonadaceae bacterium]
MGVTNYYSVDGEMVGDYDGVDHRDYLRDAVGSVTRITEGTTNRYKPFGQDRVVDLHLPRPRFGWIGVYGYEATYLSYSHHYVKARHYEPNIGRWTTVDPLWPSEPAYTYVGNNPTNWIDPTGTWPSTAPPPPFGVQFIKCSTSLQWAVYSLCRAIENMTNAQQAAINRCIGRAARARGRACPYLTDDRLNCLQQFCGGSGVIDCSVVGTTWAGMAPGYFGPRNSPTCQSPYILIDKNYGDQATFDAETKASMYVVIHEIAHTCGVDHVIGQIPGKPGKIHYADKSCNNVWVCCINNVLLKGGKGDDCAKSIK